MVRLFVVGVIVCFLLGVVPVRVEALTFSELTTLYETSLAPPGPNSVLIDGVQVFSSEFNGFVDIDTATGDVIYYGPHNKDAELAALAAYFDIPLLSAGSIGTPESAAATTSNQVYENLVVPSVVPKTLQKRTKEKKQLGGARMFGGKISVDWVDINDGAEEGNVYNFSIGIAQDYDNYTIGVIIPYDRLDFDTFDANRIGLIPFAQYRHDLSDVLKATLSTNLNYTYNDFSFDGGNDEEINTYGGGLSAALHFVQESYEAGCGLSWQYNEDDVDLKDNHQHLIKLGSNVGVHVTEEQVINLFGLWNKDITDYEEDYGDDNYFDLGVEYRADFSNTWTINLGYKKSVALEDYDSDMTYIGSTWLF